MPRALPLTHQLAFLQRLAAYWNVGGRLPLSSHDLACLQAAQVTLLALLDDEADGPWPDVIDLCPCADCTTPLLWTRLHDVRTAWQVHYCPLREEPRHV